MTERKRAYNAAITAVDRFLPSRVVSNHDIEKIVDTSDSWIRERTGISERRFLDGKPTSHMAVEVAKGLLRKRQIEADEVDLIIVATITPDMVFPSTACLVQDRIGAERAWGYDLSAACSGFVFAIVAGAQFIESGAHEKVIVIGADKMSSIIDVEDRTTYVLFGDGDGGVLLERSETEGEGLVDFELGTDGSGGDNLYMAGGGSKEPASHDSVDRRLHYVRQEGRAVFKVAVTKMAEVSLSVLAANGLSVDDVDLFIPHQANGRIITATAERMNLPPEKAYLNVDRYANTTNATIPIALSEACDTNRLSAGDLMQITAFGGGYTWGSALFRWGAVRDG